MNINPNKMIGVLNLVNNTMNVLESAYKLELPAKSIGYFYGLTDFENFLFMIKNNSNDVKLLDVKLIRKKIKNFKSVKIDHLGTEQCDINYHFDMN